MNIVLWIGTATQRANKQIMDTGDGTPHFLKSLAELPLTQTGQKQQRVLPKGPGEKTLTIRGTDEESEKLDSFLSDQLAALSAQRVATLKTLSIGVWKNDLGLVHITVKKGGHWSTHGHTHLRGQLFLQPEEALFFMECGSLEVLSNGLPMTIQEAYHTMLEDIDIQLYKVYASLKRLGYVITRVKYTGSEFQETQKAHEKSTAVDKCHIKTDSCCPLCTPTHTLTSTQLLEVYQPRSSFQKTNPGPPDYRMLIARSADPFPSIDLLRQLMRLHPQAPLKFSVVDGTNMTYYSVTAANIHTLAS